MRITIYILIKASGQWQNEEKYYKIIQSNLF